MTKKYLIIAAGLITTAAVLGYLISRRPPRKDTPKPHKPNVVFIVLDDVRADHLSACGYNRPTATTLSRLLGEGASLACRAYSPGTWTHPSHASFFTGEEVHIHQADFDIRNRRVEADASPSRAELNPLHDKFPTLAEKMKAAGYQTLAVSGNPVVSKWAHTGLVRGFDEIWQSISFGDLYGKNLVEKVREAVSQIDESRPAFFFVNICDAHIPWQPVPPGIRWAPARRGLAYFPNIPINPFGRFFRGEMLADEKEQFVSHATDLYDYAVFRGNLVLHRVLELLKRKNIFGGDFRLVITSDHGEMLGEHDLMIHGVFTYEPGVAVPLLYMDKARTKIPFAEPISALTSYDLALLGRLPDNPRPVRSVGYPAPDKWLGGRNEVTMASQWSGNEKLTWKNGEYMLVDLEADPGELNPKPLPEDHALREEFSKYVHQATDDKNFGGITHTPEMIEALKKLGYLEY